MVVTRGTRTGTGDDPGESVEYVQSMECFDPDGPTVEAVGDVDASD